MDIAKDRLWSRECAILYNIRLLFMGDRVILQTLQDILVFIKDLVESNRLTNLVIGGLIGNSP